MILAEDRLFGFDLELPSGLPTIPGCGQASGFDEAFLDTFDVLDNNLRDDPFVLEPADDSFALFGPSTETPLAIDSFDGPLLPQDVTSYTTKRKTTLSKSKTNQTKRNSPKNNILKKSKSVELSRKRSSETNLTQLAISTDAKSKTIKAKTKLSSTGLISAKRWKSEDWGSSTLTVTNTKSQDTTKKMKIKPQRMKWTTDEITTLWKMISIHGNEWREVQKPLKGRTYHQVKDKGRRLLQQQLWKTGRTKMAADGAYNNAKSIAQQILNR